MSNIKYSKRLAFGICSFPWALYNHRDDNFVCSYNHLIINVVQTQATREEAEIRLAEMKKSSYEFNRDIVLGAKNLVSKLVIYSYKIISSCCMD